MHDLVVREPSPRERRLFSPYLETARCVLEPPRMSDAHAVLAGWARDEEATRYLLWSPHTGMDVTLLVLAQMAHAWTEEAPSRPWVIRVRGDHKPIGMIAAEVEQHRVQLGYVLARSAWGQGYMTEIVSELTTRALEAGFARVEGLVHPENRGSLRVLEKAGFALEGRLRRYHVFPTLGSEPCDTLILSRCA